MNSYVTTAVAAITTALLGFPATGTAQVPSKGSAKVMDLTNKDFTADDLINTLKPKTRGIAPVDPIEPQCKNLEQKRSRGIKLTPEQNTAMAAIHVPFAVNSAELSPDATKSLDTLAAALKSPELASYCFQIAGYTDSTGGEEYNLDLSKRRAESAVHYLVDNDGVTRDRLVAVGYGMKDPIASNDTDDGKQKNRRVQIANLGTGTVANAGAPE